MAKVGKTKVSIAKLQREAIRLLNRINNNDKTLKTVKTTDMVYAQSQLFPNILVKYIFSLSTNYITITVSEKSELTGYADTVKRVDFKYTQNTLAA